MMTTRTLRILTLSLALGVVSDLHAQPVPTPAPTVAASQLGATPTPAPPPVAELAGPTVELIPSSKNVELGEVFQLRAMIATGEGEFESLDLKIPKEQSNFVIIEDAHRQGARQFIFDVRVIKSGDVFIGPIDITAKASGSNSTIPMKSPGFKVSVNAPAPREGEAEIKLRDYTGTRAIPFNYLVRNLIIAAIVALVLVILAIIALVIGYYMKRRAALAALPPPPLPPLQEALITAQRLRTLEVFRRLGVDPHYTELSMAIRRYIERQLGARAIEMTDDEVTAMLRRDLVVIPGATELIDVMMRSSYAKFAKEPITETIAISDCDILLRFLHLEEKRLDEERRRREAREVRQEARTA